MPDASIFISYRRDDAAGYARAVADALAQRFGAERVFIDVDDIAAGQPFDDVIGRAVGSSRVLLVLIGRRWLGERDGLPPRISEPGDMVRREVAAALAAGMQVIPLLLDGAAMPAPAVLPADVRPLAGRNAMELSNSRFAADIERLVGVLRTAAGVASQQPAAAAPVGAPAARGRGWAPAAALVVGLAVVAAVVVSQRRGEPSAPLAAARPAINGVWQAAVSYDWPNAHYTERFEFGGDGAVVHGSASFLRVPRGIVDGSVGADGLGFATRSTQTTGAGSETLTHRYRARLAGDVLEVVLQTEGGSVPHVPVAFTARRAAAAAPGASAGR